MLQNAADVLCVNPADNVAVAVHTHDWPEVLPERLAALRSVAAFAEHPGSCGGEYLVHAPSLQPVPHRPVGGIAFRGYDDECAQAHRRFGV
jgi:hypothetical protein